MRNRDRHGAVDSIRGTKNSPARDAHHQPVHRPVHQPVTVLTERCYQIGGPTSRARVLTARQLASAVSPARQSLPARRKTTTGSRSRNLGRCLLYLTSIPPCEPITLALIQ